MNRTGNSWHGWFLARSFTLAGGVFIAVALAPRSAATVDREIVLHKFCSQSGCADGDSSNASLIMDAAGNLYGITVGNGGADINNLPGTVFELTPTNNGWDEKVLYNFCSQNSCIDGARVNPDFSGLIVDAAGNLYGATGGGGNPGCGGSGCGVVFELTPNQDRTAWTQSVLYRFCSGGGACADGATPQATLTLDGQGNLYGTTYLGGNQGCLMYPDGSRTGCGVVFKLTPNSARTVWTETVLHTFCSEANCADSEGPISTPLIIDGEGNLYGTTSGFGFGAGSWGSVFELSPNPAQTAWTHKVLYTFCSQSNCTDGFGPGGGVIMDAAGNLYGTAVSGGNQSRGVVSERGVVFELSPNPAHTAWTESVLYSFCVQPNCADGAAPQTILIMGGAGNLYGTASEGGANPSNFQSVANQGGGVVFELSPNQGRSAWTYELLYSFCGQSGCADGELPQNGLIMDASGNLYGTTSAGGRGAGTVFELVPPSSTLVAAELPASRSVEVGGTATAFATIINAGAATAPDCALAPAAALPLTFHYQTTNPSTNQVTGTPDTPVTLAAGAQQSFVIGLTTNAAFRPTNLGFSFACANVTPAPSHVGLNTLLLSASNTPVPDVVALAATAQNDGIVHVTGSPSQGAFAVATINLGAGAAITASANTGAASLPLTINLCQTNPATGQCVSAVGPSVTTTIGANATPTFAILVSASGAVAFDPANSRITVQFADSGGAVRGATSVAVETR